MLRHATAVWTGDLRSGTGAMSAKSGAFTEMPYTFDTRFESSPGTNPEELIAAAHAACFSMALSGELVKAKITPIRLETTAEVTLEKVDGKQTVTRSHLRLKAQVNGGDRAAFDAAAEAARAGCPISRLLKAEITHEAVLEAPAARV